MQANYKTFIDRVIAKYEGGYGWDSADPGGPTKYGITYKDLAEHRHLPEATAASWASRVRSLTLQEAEDIYVTKYARQCRFDDLNSGPDCAILDFGINSGSSRAIKYAQRVVGTSQDGILGPITLAAINKMNPIHFTDALCDARLNFLRNLSIWRTFGRGWTARVADVKAYCRTIAGKTVAPTPAVIAAAEPAALPSGKGVPLSWWQRFKNAVT